MQFSHAISGLHDAVETQLRLVGPEVGEAGAQLMLALQPAIRQTMMDVVAMAASEVSSQLPTHKVEVRLSEGDPELVVTDDTTAIPGPPTLPGAVDDEARITLRLPGYLKDLIGVAATDSGDSVNSYVVDALKTQTQPKKTGMTRHRTTIEL